MARLPVLPAAVRRLFGTCCPLKSLRNMVQAGLVGHTIWCAQQEEVDGVREPWRGFSGPARWTMRHKC